MLKMRYHPGLILVVFILFAGFVGLMLYFLRDNVNYFKPPALITSLDRQDARFLRLGGVVEVGSVYQEGAQFLFYLTDEVAREKVSFQGVLPDLFREGQEVIVEGHFTQAGEFMATRVLAKHDENYMTTETANRLSAIQQ